MNAFNLLYVGAALSPLTKSDRRCYYSLEKVTMICRSTTKRPTAGSHFVSARVRNGTGSIGYTGYDTAACTYNLLDGKMYK